jgi:hypothetical protein
MANEKKPLLMDELTATERISLAGLKLHPGFAVLEKLLMAACKRATDDVMKLDPIEEAYERKLKALQQKGRERHEFTLLVLMSVDWQTQAIAIQDEEKNEKPEVNRIVKGLK